MPYINLKTNTAIKDKTAVKAKLGELITLIPGKSEARTMISLLDKQDMYFGGSDESCAIVVTLVNKGTDHSNNKEYANAVINMVAAEMDIPRTRVYCVVNEEDDWFSIR